MHTLWAEPGRNVERWVEPEDEASYSLASHAAGYKHVWTVQSGLKMWDAIVCTCPSRESAISLRKGKLALDISTTHQYYHR